MPTLFKNDLHEALKMGEPYRKDVDRLYKKVKVVDENGEERRFEHIEEFIKFLEDFFLNGKTLTRAEKFLIQSGIEGEQWEIRKKIMELLEKIAEVEEDK